jgi:hypothetical protein
VWHGHLSHLALDGSAIAKCCASVLLVCFLQDVGSPCTAYCDGLRRQLAQHQEVESWRLYCNEDIEGNDIVPRGSGTLRVNGIGECAMVCFNLSPDSANLSNATKCKDKERRRECCQSFVYKPSSKASKDNCSLK